MRTFKDCEGRTWSVTLNVHQMKRIRANLGVDLVNVIALEAGGKVKVDLVDRIANDPCLLVDILWVCVEEEAKAAGVTDEQFGRSLAGDAIEDATRRSSTSSSIFSPERSASSSKRRWNCRGSTRGR